MPKELSAADVKHEIDDLRPNLFLEETEDSWEKIAKAITSLIKICENGGYDVNPSEMVTALRASHRPIISAMNSERTRLCLIPLELLRALATAMGGEFEQLLPVFMPPLLALCGRTNKVVINGARKSIFTIIESTQLASVLPYFLQNIKDKSASLKLVIAEGTLACLNSCNPPDLEKESRAAEIEAIIRATARDANADVRKVSRKIFESYKILLPSRVPNFTAPLSPTTKKYLDIKAAPIATQKSSSNLRSNPTLKPEVKPSASTSTAKPSHSRTASTSTLSTGTAIGQTRNAPTTLSRVARKEPATAAPASYAPVRPVQPTRVISESQRSNIQKTNATTAGAVRSTLTQDQKRPIPPLRSQSSTVSRVAGTAAARTASSSSGAPHRIQLNAGNPSTGSGAQPAASSGPRRVPMPPPAAPPAATKDKEGPKRPTSRVDNATSSNHRPVVPPAPMKKKPISTLSSSLKDRAPVTNPAVQPKPTTTTTAAPVAAAGPSSSGNSTKPLAVAKAKPQWGRSAPTAKPAPAAPQKASAKAVVKKPSSRVLPKAGVSKTRPVTPAMIALPPSPTPAEEEAGVEDDVATSKDETSKQARKEEEKVLDEENTADIAVDRDAAVCAPIPDVEIAATEEAEQTIQSNEYRKAVDCSPADDTPHTSTISEGENCPTLQIEGDSKDSDSSLLPSNTDQAPHTPQGLLPNPSTNNAASALTSKTPISALLSSIERGFIYSPITPLSPADLYLPDPNGATPYSHQTHAARLQGPRQPFNYALHAHEQTGIFGSFAFGGFKKEEEMVRGDIGVVKLQDHDKLFMHAGMDDATTRHAFLELNQ
ncbi:clasp N terminal-domain-containing protein [Flammula alnicola]|nr:clasp N terminal-domain-containing protein [Flammula alnicola]